MIGFGLLSWVSWSIHAQAISLWNISIPYVENDPMAFIIVNLVLGILGIGSLFLGYYSGHHRQ